MHDAVETLTSLGNHSLLVFGSHLVSALGCSYHPRPCLSIIFSALQDSTYEYGMERGASGEKSLV